MQLGVYEIVYILTNVFSTYTVFKFMTVFFNRKGTNSNKEMLSYIGYYFCITLVYLIINIPIVMLLCNTVAFYLLTLNYSSSIKKRISAVLLIYLILMCVEMLVALLSGYTNFPIAAQNNYSSVWGLACAKILSYAVVIAMSNFKNIKKGDAISPLYWLCTFLIPIISLYLLLLLFQVGNLSTWQLITSVAFMSFLNFSVFFMYDAIGATMSDKLTNLLIAQQHKYYDEQFKIMRISLKNTNSIVHDLRNHIMVLRSYALKDDNGNILAYLSKMGNNLTYMKQYASSQNLEIDSILNFKIQEAEQKGIKVLLDLSIPNSVDFPAFDAAIILGNLLDNAIKAAGEAGEKSYIDIKIKYDRGRLAIVIANPFVGNILKDNDSLMTTKKNACQHGIGLSNVRNALIKYKGSMDASDEGNIFSVSLLLYI